MSPKSSTKLPHATTSAFCAGSRVLSMSLYLDRQDLILVYPQYHVSPSFNAGIPIDKSVDSMTLNADLSRERLQSESAAIHDPEIEGRERSGGKMYNSNDIWTKRENWPGMSRSANCYKEVRSISRRRSFPTRQLLRVQHATLRSR